MPIIHQLCIFSLTHSYIIQFHDTNDISYSIHYTHDIVWSRVDMQIIHQRCTLFLTHPYIIQINNTHAILYTIHYIVWSRVDMHILHHAHIPYTNYIFVMIWQAETKISLHYGVATISRLLKIIGLFCRISSLL